MYMISVSSQGDMESLQSFYNTDSKKLTPLSTPPRQPGDMAFFNRTDPIGELQLAIRFIAIIVIISILRRVCMPSFF